MLDELDLKILRILQDNGRMKRNQLSEHIGLSIPSVSDRMNKMEEKGVIEGYYTKVNRKSFNYDIMAFVTVISDSSKHYKGLVENAKKNPYVLECHSILGEGSHLLKTIVKNTESLEKLLAEIQSWPGVLSTHTNFVLSTHKETSRVEV